MNEQIRKLARQCYEAGPIGKDGWPEYSKFNEIKFAEFIVRECMDIISDESEKVSDEWRCKDGKHIWWKIKEHFGVEE